MPPPTPPSDDDDAWDRGLDGVVEKDNPAAHQAERIRRELLRELSQAVNELDRERLQKLEDNILRNILRATTPSQGSRQTSVAKFQSRVRRYLRQLSNAVRGPRVSWRFRWDFPSGAIAGAAFSLLISTFWLGSMDRALSVKTGSLSDPDIWHQTQVLVIEVDSPKFTVTELTSLLIADGAQFEVLCMSDSYDVRIKVMGEPPSATSKWLNERGVSINRNSEYRLLVRRSQ